MPTFPPRGLVADFCEQVRGYRPAPLAPEVYETEDQDAPWLKNA